MSSAKMLLSSLPLLSKTGEVSELNDRELSELLYIDKEQECRTAQSIVGLNVPFCNTSVSSQGSSSALASLHRANNLGDQKSSLLASQPSTAAGIPLGNAKKSIDENHASHSHANPIETSFLCDAALLCVERRRHDHPVQEAWLHQGLHYQRWDEAFLQRGSSYHTNSIATRATFGMSHTKSLCISLNMHPSLLGTTDLVGISAEHASTTDYNEKIPPEARAWASNDKGDATTNRVIPLFMWQSPQFIPGDQASILSQISEQLRKQYHALAPRPLVITSCLNQRASDLGQALDKARKEAGTSKVIFHYYARGIPKPRNGTMFLMNGLAPAGSCAPFTSISLDMLRVRSGFPLVFIADCANAGALLEDFILKRKEQEQQHRFLSREHEFVLSGSRPVSSADLDTMPDVVKHTSTGIINFAVPRLVTPDLAKVGTASSFSTMNTVFEDFFFIGASGSGYSQGALPEHDCLPSDILTSCLTTPLRLAMTWFMVKHSNLTSIHPILLHVLPGALQDKKTPLGQLQWHFQSITECIAWSSFPISTFSKLFREDIYLAPLFRGYLLAERVIVGGLGGTLSVYPLLPTTHNHPIWDLWENLLERSFVAVLKLVRPAPPVCLTRFEFREWLDAQATRWKYNQDGVPIEPNGTALPRLPTLAQTHPLRLPDLLLEEFRGMDALMEQVTSQAFCMPTLNKKGKLTSHLSEGNHCKNRSYSEVSQKSLGFGVNTAYIHPTQSAIRSGPTRWKHFHYENQSLRFFKRQRWERGSEYDMEWTDFANRSYGLESRPAPTCLLSPFSPHHMRIKTDDHADKSNVTLSTKSHATGIASGCFGADMGSASVTSAAEYVANVCAFSSITNSPANSLPASFPFIKQMPIILQGLLVMAYRERATSLVCRLVDVGVPAVLQCAEANLYRLVLDHYWKRADLRFLMPSTLFIYCKTYYVDPDLVGSPEQQSTVVQACVEVLKRPIKVYGARMMDPLTIPESAVTTSSEPGAWQAKLLGFYSSSEGQRLLACSILALLAIHSGDARDSCHRFGAFQLVCRLLQEICSQDEGHKHFSASLQKHTHSRATPLFPRSKYTSCFFSTKAKYDSTTDDLNGSVRRQSSMTSQNANWQTDRTQYAMAVTALFVALLHNWSPSPDEKGKEQAAGIGAFHSLDPSRSSEENKQDEVFSPTNPTDLKSQLWIALGALEQLLYSAAPVLRGSALRSLSMVITSNATDLSVKYRSTALLQSYLNNATTLCFEGNTDLRLEMVGVAFVLYKFLMEEASKYLSQDRIRSYVTQWLCEYETIQPIEEDNEDEKDVPAEGLKPESYRVPSPSNAFAPTRIDCPEASSVPSRRATSISGTRLLVYPNESRSRAHLLQWSYTSPSQNSYINDSMASTNDRIVISLPFSVPFSQSQNSALESHVLSRLSNLVRFVLELTEDPCPYVAAHARKVVLEEMTFLLEGANPSLDDPNEAVPFAMLYHSVDVGEVVSGRTYRGQSSWSPSDAQKRGNSFSLLCRQRSTYNNDVIPSKNYLEKETRDAICADKRRRKYIISLFRKAMTSVIEIRSQINQTDGANFGKPESSPNAMHYLAASPIKTDKHKSRPSLTNNLPSSRDCFQNDDNEFNRTLSALLPENITLRALSAQDSTTVPIFVYSLLGYIGDLLLVKLDDYDPRNPFNQDKESKLRAHMLALARQMSEDVFEPTNELLKNFSRHLVYDEDVSKPRTAKKKESYGITDNLGPTKVVIAEQNDDVLKCRSCLKLMAKNTAGGPIEGTGSVRCLLFHPARPYFITATSLGVIQCLNYSESFLANGHDITTTKQTATGSLKVTSCFRADRVLKRCPFAMPKRGQLFHAFSNSPSWSFEDFDELSIEDNEASVDSFGWDLVNGFSLLHRTCTLNPIDAIHLVDVAYRPLLCAVHRNSVVELFSNFEYNETVRRVSTFRAFPSLSLPDSVDSSLSAPHASSVSSFQRDCLSSYQEQSKLLYLCNSGVKDPAVMLCDLSCERMTSSGYGHGEYGLQPPAVLASHPYVAPLFGVGVEALFNLYDRRRSGARAVDQFDFSGFTLGSKKVDSWRCLHAHFSCRCPYMFVSGYQSQSSSSIATERLFHTPPAAHWGYTALALWDNRSSKSPLNVYCSSPCNTHIRTSFAHERESLEEDIACPSSFIDVQSFSRCLRSLNANKDGVTLSEWNLPANSTRSERFNELDRVPTAASLHPFSPIVALGCGSEVVLLGDGQTK